MYKVKGITDERTDCDCCGKQNLKCTVALIPLDADGNEAGDVVYFGRQCAAYAVLGSKSARNVRQIEIKAEAEVRSLKLLIETKSKRITDESESTDYMEFGSVANMRYHNTGRKLDGSYFATLGTKIVRVDGKDPIDVKFFAELGFVQSTATVIRWDE